MKKILAFILLLATLTVSLVACGGISDVVDGGGSTTPTRDESTLGSTEAVSDPVRDSYYEDMEKIRVFENVRIEVTYGGKTYAITNEDTASTILFAITAAQLHEVSKKGDNTMQVRVYRSESLDYEVAYPFVEVADEASGRTKTYRAYINGYSAETVILDILRTDNLIES